MRRAIPLTLLLCLLGVSPACSETVRAVDVSLSADQWQEDLDYLARELPRRHVRSFGRTSQADWNRAVEGLRDDIPKLRSDRVVIELGRLVALIGDGHTELVPFQRGTGFRRLPLVFSFFESETRIIAVAPGHEALLGARVISIGGRPIEAIRDALGNLVARDNDSELLHSGPEYLATAEVLAALGAGKPTDPFALSVVSEAGAPEQVTVPVLSQEALSSIRWINARDHANVEAPLASQNQSKDYWYRYLEDHRLLFVKYNRCQDQEGEPTIRRFVKELFVFAEEHPVEKIVLDLRHNPGGDNKKNSPLVKGAAKWTLSNPDGRLFVLTGRMTFSAAVDAVIRLDHEAGAILVGAPPRGRPNTLGDVETLVLPRSGLRVDYSTKEYERMPELADAAYLPIEIPTSQRWADFVAGRDLALQAVIAFDSGRD